MIWVLSEITLPLCLSFLIGLGAGWLFWRWRRRSISQTEWESQGKPSTTDELKLSTLQEEVGVYQRKAEQLDASTQQHLNDLKKAENRTENLTAKLKAANDKLAAGNSAGKIGGEDNSSAAEQNVNFTLANTPQDDEKLRRALVREKQQASKIQELEFKSNNLQGRVDEQEKLLQQATRDLKRSKAELDTANNKLASTNTTASAESLAEAETKIAILTTEKEEAQQKLKKASNMANLQSNTTGELSAKTEALENTVKRQADELLEKNKQIQQSEITAIERDDAIAKLNQLKNKLNNNGQQDGELQQTKNQLENVRQRLGNLQASASANRQAREEQIEKLRARIEDLGTSLQQQRENRNHLELESELAQVKEESSKSLSSTQAQLAEVTTQLNNARARNKHLAASAQANTSSAVTPISVAQVTKLQKAVEEKEHQIKELEGKLKTKSSKPEKRESAPQKSKLSWQEGETKIGTPGSNHKDDLTVINGIGPKIEKSLNRLGIKSWEQLATLKVAESKRLDEKLVDFSGRITRDEWIPQAKAIIRNGHQPISQKTNKPNKKTKKNKTAKVAWQKGETKFGTPGSAHKDDLQVINGIGPVIEKALNRYGVKSWEQLASLKAKDVKTIDEALDFPGRIKRENWVEQAKALKKQFPDHKDRPTRRTFLNQVAAAR